jgi:hypothetical protein
MVEQLFGSKTRVKLLKLFYSNPNRSFFVREITRKIDEQINSVRRELANLLSIGIITSDDSNHKLYYEVNQDYLHYKSLSEIFNSNAVTSSKAKKTPGVAAKKVDNPLKPLGNVELALYTGQFTRDEHSGIDFLVVGDINQVQLDKFVADLEKTENKELRYTVMTMKEFNYRKQINDKFINGIFSSKVQVLVDKQNIMSPKKGK